MYEGKTPNWAIATIILLLINCVLKLEAIEPKLKIVIELLEAENKKGK